MENVLRNNRQFPVQQKFDADEMILDNSTKTENTESIPDELADQKYREFRNKNNEAARRCRQKKKEVELKIEEEIVALEARLWELAAERQMLNQQAHQLTSAAYDRGINLSSNLMLKPITLLSESLSPDPYP